MSELTILTAVACPSSAWTNTVKTIMNSSIPSTKLDQIKQRNIATLKKTYKPAYDPDDHPGIRTQASQRMYRQDQTLSAQAFALNLTPELNRVVKTRRLIKKTISNVLEEPLSVLPYTKPNMAAATSIMNVS